MIIILMKMHYFIMIHIRDPDRPERGADIGDGLGPVTWKRRS